MIELKTKFSTLHIKEDPIAVNQQLDFTAVDAKNILNPINLSSLKNQVKIISAVPSIDTGACQVQTTQFNNTIAGKYPDIQVIAISKDLPFAQSRFCESLKVNKNFHIWSDYRCSSDSFSAKTKLIIDELQLLARSVLIVDENNKLIYLQIVTNPSGIPDYEEILEFLDKNQKQK